MASAYATFSSGVPPAGSVATMTCDTVSVCRAQPASRSGTPPKKSPVIGGRGGQRRRWNDSTGSDAVTVMTACEPAGITYASSYGTATEKPPNQHTNPYLKRHHNGHRSARWRAA